MKSDIQIAQEAKMKNIREIAVELNLSEDDIDQYGKYKCKISLDVLERNKDNKKGKLVLVTAINPTPAGEGKSTVTIGLGQALNKRNKKSNLTRLYIVASAFILLSILIGIVVFCFYIKLCRSDLQEDFSVYQLCKRV